MRPLANRIPVICVSPSSWASAGIFNPNSWIGDSKGVVQSCGAEYSALRYGVAELSAMCKRSEELCRSQVETLIANWKSAPFDVSRCDYFVEVPSYHLLVESFFSGVKSLLDLIVQLLQTERLVAAAVHGFHRDGDVYGGRVLKVLAGNARKERREDAQRVVEFLRKQKALWVDELIQLRDDLVHPKKGMMQVMFQMDITEKDGQLVWQVREPLIATYAPATLLRVQEFCEKFIALVQGMSLE
jgi:hypothetical protein